MKTLITNLRNWRIVLLPLLLAAFLQENARAQTAAAPPPKAIAIARIWHGKTSSVKADEYYAYLCEAGIKKIQAIEGNLGVQVFRHPMNEVTEFTVISYWTSREAIRKFAGEEIEKAHALPRDPEFLIDPETSVSHQEVLLHEWKK